MTPEFMSFDEVLRELQMEHNELEMLIENGEIKAFREGEKIKFRKDDIVDYRAQKMDLPTLAVAPDQQDGFIPIEEIEEGEELEAEEESEMEDIPDDETILGMTEDEQAQPLLDISSQEQESESEFDMDSASDELVFEQESGEDLLETGELLFESKDQILPRDKEIEELFPDSEVGISPFDSREEKAIEDAWDLAEDEEGDVITMSAGSPEHLAIEESNRRNKIKTIGSIITGGLAFAVIAIFVLLPRGGAVSAILSKDQIGKVAHIDFVEQATKTSTLQPVMETFVFTAPQEGMLSVGIPAGSEVRLGDVVGRITPELKTADALTAQLQQYRKAHGQLLAKQDDLRGLREKYQKAYKRYSDRKNSKKTWKKNNPAKYIKKRRKYYEKSVDKYYKICVGFINNKYFPKNLKAQRAEELQYKKARRKSYEKYKIYRKREDADPRQISALYKSYLDEHEHYFQAKKQTADMLAAFVEKLPEQIEKIERELAGRPVEVKHSGLIKWDVNNEQAVSINQRLGEVRVVAEMIVSFDDITDTEEVEKQGWQKDRRITLECAGRKVKGRIEKRTDYKTYSPPHFNLEIMLDEAQGVKANEQVVLCYPQKKSGLGVPAAAIRQDQNGAYIFMIEDGKLHRRTVKTKGKDVHGNIEITNVEQGEEFVAGELEDLQDGQAIRIKD